MSNEMKGIAISKLNNSILDSNRILVVEAHFIDQKNNIIIVVIK